MKKYVGLVSIAILVQACSGGGSSSNTTTTPVTAVKPVTTVTPIAAPKYSIVSTEKITIIPNPLTGAEILPANLTVNLGGTSTNSLNVTSNNNFKSVLYSKNNADSINYSKVGSYGESANYGTIFGNYTKNGVTYAFSKVINQDDRFVFYARNAPQVNSIPKQWTYSDVGYGYFVSNGATTGPGVAGKGSITADITAGTWNADFGDVKLTGVIVGKDVSGKAVYTGANGTINGTFIGFDHVIIGSTTFFESFGGFVGDNGNQSTLSGAWIKGQIVTLPTNP